MFYLNNLMIFIQFHGVKSYKNKQMKILQVAVLFLAVVSVTTEPLQLYSASTFLDSNSGPLTGSLLGGRTIYIKGIGFPSDPNQIEVLVGSFPCKIPADGLTPTTLSCETSSTGSMTNLVNLPIKVISNFEVYVLNGFTFSYVDSETPIITDVFPSASIGDKMLAYYGRHRVLNSGDGARNMGDFIGIWAGNALCGMFDIQQGEISYNGISKVKCLQAREQEAGRYNVSEHVVAGWATKQWSMRKPSLTKNYYEHTVLPAISSITPTSGAMIGQDIVIKGSGFSTNKAKISVTVDSVPCEITSSTLSEISCRVGAKQPSNTAQLSTNSATVANNYIAGAGFRYERYDITGLVNRNINGFKTAVNSGSAEVILVERGHVAELETQDTYGPAYGQVFKGYFFAPVSGNYIFRGVSDDTFTLLIASQYGSTASTLVEQIYETTVGASDENHYISNHTSAIGREKTLVGGKYYYMQAYHVNWAGPGYFKISVQVPNTDSTLIKKRYEINHIETTFTNDPQLMTFTLHNAVSGTFSLQVYRVDPVTLQVTYNKVVQIAYNASMADFQNAINQFDSYGQYWTSCVDAKAYDAAGNAVSTGSSQAVKFQWTVSVYKLRSDAHLNEKFRFNLNNIVTPAGTTSDFTETRTKPHGPLLTGTFTLSVGSTPIKIYDSVSRTYSNYNIPADVDSWTLAAGFRQILGFEKVEVYRTNPPGYGNKWIISYVEYTGNVPDLAVSGSGLIGGKAGTFPTISFTETRAYSPNIIFNPVNEQFLFIPSPKPNIIVNVNGISSVCLTNCEYTFLPNTPLITSQTLSGSTLSITLSNPLSINYPLDMLAVKIDGQVCTINAGGSFGAFTCQLPVNADGSPVLKAGDHNAEILLMEVGYIQVQSGVAPVHYGLAINSVNQPSGGTNGGYELVLKGNGFPQQKGARITLCGVQVQILSSTNTETKILAPPCSTAGAQTIAYFYNNQTATVQFTYTSPAVVASILQISPKSASPVLKAIMTITGNGFGTNISAVGVSLANLTGKVYKMRVLELNDTVIKCGIPGGLPGNFDVKVSIDGIGDVNPVTATADDFVYELVVESVSPANVAYYGGTLLTITGRNFSPDKLENLVHIGNELNWLCSIESLTPSQIKCRVPPTHPDWSSPTQNIVINNRLILDSTCPSNTCSIAYTPQASSPTLTSANIGQAISGTGSIILYGTNLDVVPAADVRIIFENKLTREITVVVPGSGSAGGVSGAVPGVQAGYYTVRVRLDPVGDTNSLELTVKAAVSSTAISSSIKGGIVTINGQGLPTEWPSKLFTLKLRTNSFYYTPTIVSASSTKLQLSLPEGVSGQVHSLTLTNPVQQTFNIAVTQTVASTPTLSVLTSSPQSAGGALTIDLNRTNFNTVNPDIVQVYNILDVGTAQNVSWISNGTAIRFISTLNAGQYKFKVYYNGYGWADVQGKVDVSAPGVYTAASVDSSYAGGQIVVTGANISPQAVIKVGGFSGKAISVSASSVTFQIPPLVTSLTLQTYPELSTVSKITPYQILSDTAVPSSYSFDGSHSTYYSSNNTECYIGLDSGPGTQIKVQRIRYFPYSRWVIAASYIKDAVFEASNDGISYIQIGVVDQTVHAGWNSILVTGGQAYRYIRLRHNNVSNCKIAELEVYGHLLNTIRVPAVSSFTTDATFFDGFNTFVLTNAITYKVSATPVITATNPSTLSVYGGQLVSITGQYLNTGSPKIFIDSIECLPTATPPTSTLLTCTTQPRPTLPEHNTFTVALGGNEAIIRSDLFYVMRWSDIKTWGTDLPPVEGDLVYVPKGMVLYVDQSTPRLDGIVVEDGKIIFADQADMEIHTNLITVNRGEFRAGTETKPHTHKLTFIMYGSYYGKQQPMFGNKGIGCMECKFSMYGTPRLRTWTVISSTINIGDTTFSVQDSVDWKVGEEIVVASTEFDHNQAEQRTITGISGTTITVGEPFKYKHLGVVENYGSSDRLEIKAQVGLLTRNIKMTGDPTSEAGQYGSHLMMAGSAQKGLVSHIAYTEFTHCGQPRIVGRYCIHFHMNGDVVDSYAKGNSVHHSFARVITIHGVHFLRVSENVGYRVKGHNFFIEDGIETQNVIENNLVIGSLESWNMMQTDISVASFWVTNPTNHLRNNRAAGGDFYGFWYEIKTHPDGPSATEDICPIGNPLGQSHDNVAHSYRRFGLRIFKLYSRERPCDAIRQDWLPDPWSENPSIQSKFYNYVLYKNGQTGLLAEQTGNTIFENFTISDCKRAGMQFYRTNFTKQNVEARNFAIIGLSRANGGTITTMNNSAGVIAPRTSGWGMSNIRFYNFATYMHVFQACSHCDLDLLFTNVANEYLVSGVSYTNISGKYLRLNGLSRQIIYDLDASFSSPFNGGSRTSATVVNALPHLVQEAGCSAPSNPTLWGNTIVCDQSLTIRKVTFTNLVQKTVFEKAPLKVQLLSDVLEDVPENSTSFSQAFSVWNDMEPMIDHKNAFSLAFAAGRIYNIWWLTGLDFTHLNIDVSKFFIDSDPAIIFRFNYTQVRQSFQIGHLVNGAIEQNLTDQLFNQTLDPTSCQIGDYTHDVDNRYLTLCATNRGKLRTFEYLDVVGIKCRYICPSDEDDFVKEKFLRVWSNTTQWPGGVLPRDGENITVPGEWTILMDIQPAVFGNLIIRGDLIIPDTIARVHIKARNIWIWSGSIKAGTSTTPYPGELIFEIIGNKTDRSFVIDPQLAGNKMFVVTGNLELYGTTPATTWTRLTVMARPNDTSITVQSTAGWQVGGQLAIAPSFSSSAAHQKVTITGISGNTVTFTPALRHTHYGAPSVTITNAVGTLDTRAGVGYLTRKIKIRSGDDAGWGFQLVAYGFVDNTTLRSGGLVLSGVELYEGGQYDTENSALKVLNTVKNKTVKIFKSSFHDCKSLCLDIKNINNAQITHNIFYNGRLFLTRANKLLSYKFQTNLMIAATRRPTISSTSELVSCYATYDPIHNSSSSVRYNLCQGSDGHGFILPFVPCSMADVPPYEDNTVGSAFIGWVFNKIQQSCLAGSGAKAYACYVGHIAGSPNTIQVIFQKFMIADCNRGLTLRFGKQNDDSTAYLRNSYVSAISRPTCSQCYGTNATTCRDGRGVRMLAVTVNGESMPSIAGIDFDIICRRETFDCKAFVEDVIFENFNINYGELPQCSNNAAFEPHRVASDLTGTHHLYNTVCNNCSLNALARFTPPLPQHLGWSGGCGRIPCTGKNNYMIQDHTGHYLGSPSLLLANNTQIGNKTQGCTYIPYMNGHHCMRLDFGVIEYESIAPDFNTRIMWPVYLKFDGGLWNTTTNGWREWEWEGNQPLNLRLARFVSIVQVNQVYNMTFQSEPPIDMRFQFQRRTQTGNNSEYIVIKMHYPRPNSIRVQNRDKVMKPISLLDNHGQNPLNITVCGSNKFFYENYTIHFVLTADRDCQVRVSLTNSIQLTARFNMDINDFFAIDGQTKFIDRMCAVLGILDTSRLKIVGIYNGSVTVVAYIDEQLKTDVTNATQNDNDLQKSDIGVLNKKLSSVYLSGELNDALVGAGLGTILDFESNTYFHKYDPIQQQAQLAQLAQQTKSLIIALTLASLSIVVVIIVGVVYFKKKGAQIENVSTLNTEAKMEDTIVDTYSVDAWK